MDNFDNAYNGLGTGPTSLEFLKFSEVINETLSKKKIAQLCGFTPDAIKLANIFFSDRKVSFNEAWDYLIQLKLGYDSKFVDYLLGYFAQPLQFQTAYTFNYLSNLKQLKTINSVNKNSFNNLTIGQSNEFVQ